VGDKCRAVATFEAIDVFASVVFTTVAVYLSGNNRPITSTS